MTMTLASAIPHIMDLREVIKLFNDIGCVAIVGTHPINAMEVGSTASRADRPNTNTGLGMRHREAMTDFMVIPHTGMEVTTFMNAEYQQELSVVITLESMAEETVPKAILSMKKILWRFL
jgi:hypothetical protein